MQTKTINLTSIFLCVSHIVTPNVSDGKKSNNTGLFNFKTLNLDDFKRLASFLRFLDDSKSIRGSLQFMNLC